MATEEAKASLLESARLKLRGRGPQCSVGVLLRGPHGGQIAELLANTGEEINGEKRGEGIPYSVAAETISEGTQQKVDGQTISRHLRGRCFCQ